MTPSGAAGSGGAVRRRAAWLIGTGLGAGYSPVASGTAGSLLGVLLYLPLAGRSPALFFTVFALVAVTGAWAAGVLGELFETHDDGRIVVDEIAGMLVTCFSFPATAGWLIAAFLVFRFMDITKPFPARRIDVRWRSAAGVMADDLLAGLYANLVLQVARMLW